MNRSRILTSTSFCASCPAWFVLTRVVVLFIGNGTAEAPSGGPECKCTEPSESEEQADGKRNVILHFFYHPSFWKVGSPGVVLLSMDCAR